MTLVIALQGYWIDGKKFLRRSRLREDVAGPLGTGLVLLDEQRKNWPACWPSGSVPFDVWRGELVSIVEVWRDTISNTGGDPERERCILIGHSDGATMALRLAVACREYVAGVASYAGMYSHFVRGAGTSLPNNLPPALFLTNEHDALVPPVNAQDLANLWGNHGGATQCNVIDCQHTRGLRSHEWQPSANSLIRDWICERQKDLGRTFAV